MDNESLLKHLPKPSELAVLDPSFRPAALAERAFRQAAEASGSAVEITLALEQADSTVSSYDSLMVPDRHELADAKGAP